MFSFSHKRSFLSVFLNTNTANSFNHSFIPPSFVEPGIVPGAGDSAGNNTDRVPVLMEFTFWCVDRGGIRRDEAQKNLGAMCQVAWRAKEKKSGCQARMLKMEASEHL